MSITLSSEARKEATASIERFADQELEVELSGIQATQLLDYFLKEIAPSVYNGAIADAQVFMRDRLGDLEASCFQGEFTYWPKGTSVKRKR
jgi:uncharacterized protein (DUF2164 family)